MPYRVKRATLPGDAGLPAREFRMVTWREKLGLRSARDARDAVLHALPDHLGDLTPIGVVRNTIQDTSGRRWAQVESEIIFREEVRPALEGLEGFSHVIVVTWLDRVTDAGRALLRIHPSGDASSPEVGVFATRTAHRPNPIAVSIVPVQGMKDGMVRVRGLDVATGTAVLDIKPYVPFFDAFPEARIPKWAE